MDLRINETLSIGEVGNLAYRGAKAGRKPHLPVSRLVGAVSNCADAVRLKTAPTGPGENIVIQRLTFNRSTQPTDW